MGHPCDLAGESHLNGYWAQSRLWPFSAGRTFRGKPRGTAEFLRDSVTMNNPPKTVIVTGASQGIGAGIVRAFLARGYDVVGTARNATKSRELSASDHLALIDGDIGQFETAQKVAELAIKKFGSIDAVVANAGIFVVSRSLTIQRTIFARS